MLCRRQHTNHCLQVTLPTIMKKKISLPFKKRPIRAQISFLLNDSESDTEARTDPPARTLAGGSAPHQASFPAPPSNEAQTSADATAERLTRNTSAHQPFPTEDGNLHSFPSPAEASHMKLDVEGSLLNPSQRPIISGEITGECHWDHWDHWDHQKRPSPSSIGQDVLLNFTTPMAHLSLGTSSPTSGITTNLRPSQISGEPPSRRVIGRRKRFDKAIDTNEIEPNAPNRPRIESNIRNHRLTSPGNSSAHCEILFPSPPGPPQPSSSAFLNADIITPYQPSETTAANIHPRKANRSEGRSARNINTREMHLDPSQTRGKAPNTMDHQITPPGSCAAHRALSISTPNRLLPNNTASNSEIVLPQKTSQTIITKSVSGKPSTRIKRTESEGDSSESQPKPAKKRRITPKRRASAPSPNNLAPFGKRSSGTENNAKPPNAQKTPPLSAQSTWSPSALRNSQTMPSFRPQRVANSVPCDICNAMFCNLEAVKRHKRSSHTRKNGQSRHVICPECKLTVKSKQNLRRHAEVHGDDAMFPCSDCTARFKTERSRTTHMRALHGLQSSARGQSAMSFTCVECSYGSNQRTNLERHIRSVHLKERPHACPQKGCVYRASTKSNLVAHQTSYKHIYQLQEDEKDDDEELDLTGEESGDDKDEVGGNETDEEGGAGSLLPRS